jgi:hypothetical protein
MLKNKEFLKKVPAHIRIRKSDFYIKYLMNLAEKKTYNIKS